MEQTQQPASPNSIWFATKDALAGRDGSDRVTDRSERIGKKPNEADLSYTAVCTGLSRIFSLRSNGKEAKEGKRGNEGNGE